MKIGSEYRLQRIERREWEACARELRIPAKSLLARIAEVAAILPKAAERTAHALSKDGIKHPVVADLVEGIRSNTKKCVELLQKSA
jgi:hypothetical protein